MATNKNFRWISLIGIVVLVIACAGILSYIQRQKTNLATIRDAAVLAEGQQLPEGFTELSFRNEGIVGSYVEDGARLSLETHRGPRTDLFKRLTDRKTPLYEISTRFLNPKGFPFHIGGQGPLDKSWNKMPTTTPNGYEIIEQWVLAVHALEKLQLVTFREQLIPEYEALIGLIPSMRSNTVPVAPALPEVITADWKTYTSNLGYTVQYPSDWSYEVPYSDWVCFGKDVKIIPQSVEGGRPFRCDSDHILVRHSEGGQTDLEGTIAMRREIDPNVEIKRLEIDGVPAITIYGPKGAETFFSSNGNAGNSVIDDTIDDYAITLSVLNTQNYFLWRVDYESMLSTFKFSR